MGPSVFIVVGNHDVNGLDLRSLSAFECLTMMMIVKINDHDLVGTGDDCVRN